VPIERFVQSQIAATPWKNGGGRTREIVCRPTGSGMDRFDWRVSIAQISADGSFSTFLGVDRIIVLLHGAGVRLRSSNGRMDHRLGDRWKPFAFSGDEVIDATLLGGASSDFNVMTRRSTTSATMEILESEGAVLPSRGGVLFAARGVWSAVPSDGGRYRAAQRFETGEGVWWDEEPHAWNAVPLTADSAMIAVRISPRGS
jgi:hypothetical protein